MAAGSPGLQVVVGLGRSGAGAAHLLRSQGAAVLLVESRAQLTPAQEELRRQLEACGVQVRPNTPLDLALFQALPSLAAVTVSPGIPWDHPTLEHLRQQGVVVQGEMVPAWRAGASLPWVGITGTNGKTTVTHLVHHLLQHAGLQAPLCGNVGVSAADVVRASLASPDHRPDWLVVELSSYQIEAAAELAPRIALWTTLTPDHLERHGTLERYRAIKRQLLENASVAILNADDADLRQHAHTWHRPVQWVTAGARQALPPGLEARLWLEDGWVRGPEGAICPADALAMPGDHNRQNLVLAAAAALEAGVPARLLEGAFRAFPGVPHRLEPIRDLNGIRWFNDSKATNYDAAEVALKALNGPLVVLAGGQSKQGDPQAWLEQLQRQAAAVVLFGAAAPFFARLLADHGYGGAVHCCDDLSEAVTWAARQAPALGCAAVLLSPACASFDQYSDFEARGDHFRALVQGLASGIPQPG